MGGVARLDDERVGAPNRGGSSADPGVRPLPSLTGHVTLGQPAAGQPSVAGGRATVGPASTSRSERRWPTGRWWLAAALVTALAAGAPCGTRNASGAQVKPPALPDPLTQEAVQALLARLSDAEVRALLLAQLEKAARPRASFEDLALSPDALAKQADSLRSRLGDVLDAGRSVPAALGAAAAKLTEGRGPLHPLAVLLLFAAMVTMGWGAERFVRRVVGPGKWAGGKQPESLGAEVGRLLLRLAVEALGLAVFALVALAAFFAIYQGHVATRQLVLAALAGTVAVRLAGVAGHVLLAPNAPEARLVPLGDTSARRLHGAILGLATVFVLGRLGLGLWRTWGLPDDAAVLLGLGLAIAFAAIVIHAVWRVRGDIGTLIRGPEPAPPLRAWLARLWPVFVTAYVVVIFLAHAAERLGGGSLGSHAGIGSLLVLVAVPLADLALVRLLRAALGTGAGATDSSVGSSAIRYEPVLRRGIHIVLTVAGLVWVARLWGLDLFTLGARGLGERLTEALVGIAVTLLAAHLTWELVKVAIDQRLTRAPDAARPAPGEEAPTRAASRLRTVLPLLRAFLFVSVWTMAAMAILAALGVNIGPLLAGAGVVGLAVGFGAQTLVRDIVSGLFFLMDDAFRLGEYIDVGDAKGTVEKIGLRAMQLRHHRGAVYTMPYGNIRRLVNESRDWTIVKLEFRLTYDTDVAKVKKILKRIGQELLDDPELGPAILEPLKSQGIMATEDSALVVRAKFMAKPDARQYLVRREAYTRIVKAFHEQGIQFAHRQVTVLSSQPGTAAVAAGAEATGADPA